MELSIKEVNFYNKLVNKGIAEKINCPFNEIDDSHIVISKLDNDDEVCFECFQCSTIFYPGINLIEKIKKKISSIS